jgi:hypothetical protein
VSLEEISRCRKRKRDILLGTWNIRRLYRAGSLIGWIFKKWDVGVMSGLGWPRIGIGGGRFWVRWGTFGFHKTRGIPWLAANQLAFQEGLCSMELSKCWSIKDLSGSFRLLSNCLSVCYDILLLFYRHQIRSCRTSDTVMKTLGHCDQQQLTFSLRQLAPESVPREQAVSGSFVGWATLCVAARYFGSFSTNYCTISNPILRNFSSWDSVVK